MDINSLPCPGTLAGDKKMEQLRARFSPKSARDCSPFFSPRHSRRTNEIKRDFEFDIKLVEYADQNDESYVDV